jgi:hypothetical protein
MFVFHSIDLGMSVPQGGATLFKILIFHASVSLVWLKCLKATKYFFFLRLFVEWKKVAIRKILHFPPNYLNF